MTKVTIPELTGEKKIFQAFIAAQKKFGPALKTSTNPHFRSRYADLSACVEAVIDSLHEEGLALCQLTHQCDDGVCVETVLIHESGDQMTFGKLHVPASKQDAQGYGSALTYARRYSLMAAMGIAPEDDDGNKASIDTRPAAKPEPKKTSAATYDIRQMDATKIGPAVKYMRDNGCTLDQVTGLWTCPVKLEKLSSYEVQDAKA